MRTDLDEIDHHLLALLQEDSTRTLAALGELVGLSPSAVQRRVERYRATGVVERTVAVVRPPEGVLLAVCSVTLDKESRAAHAEFRAHVLASARVQQLYNVSGECDYVVVLATRGMAEHREVAEVVLKDAPHLRRYSTAFVLEPLRTTLGVPTGPG